MVMQAWTTPELITNDLAKIVDTFRNSKSVTRAADFPAVPSHARRDPRILTIS